MKRISHSHKIAFKQKFFFKALTTFFCCIVSLQALQYMLLGPERRGEAFEFMLNLYQTHNLRSEAQLLIENYSSDAEGLHVRRTLNPASRRIPKIIHQTYASASLPFKIQKYVHSWREYNPGWEVRFYDDKACLDFVKQTFPEYLEAYLSLPKPVEKSDFFRYLIVYKYGGVYTDIDTECRAPLDSFLLPTDTMVVGWEHESEDRRLAMKDHYVRAHQVLQWTFMAAPGHPVLKGICDFIKENVHTTFSNNTNMNTLEKTGPGIFTDMVMAHHRSMKPLSVSHETEWPIRFMPRIAFGTHPLNKDGLYSSSPDVKVLHHFMGKWKDKFLCWGYCGSRERWHHIFNRKAESEVVFEKKEDLIPVSTLFEPPFQMSVLPKGKEINADGSDASDTITMHGRWQAGLYPTEEPSLVDALIGSLGGHKRSAKLIDIGAGIGFYSLAAAARGHHVEAFEISSNSLKAFKDSVAFNRFESLVQIHETALAKDEFRLILPDNVGDASHGYISEKDRRQLQENMVMGLKSFPYNMLDNMISPNETVGAIRISANGWESEILAGARNILLHPIKFPPILVIEMNSRLSARAGYDSPSKVMFHLYTLGYTSVSHAGPLCDKRFKHHNKWAIFQKPETATWCNIKPEEFYIFDEDSTSLTPDNVIFYKKKDWSLDLEMIGQGTS